jgi:hypothetical protein
MLGIVLALFGVGFLVAGGVAFSITQNGYDSLAQFSGAQNVTLSYNEDGQLIDRGTTEGAQAIMTLLTEDWGYPVVESELDPADPVVNTASEYMYQMATVGYHTLHGTQTVTLAQDTEVNGELFPAGSYDVPVDGRYWTDFDRTNPFDAQVRAGAWTGTVHGLFAELGVGTVTHSALKLGLALAGLFAGIGGTLLVAGAGLYWAGRGSEPALMITEEKTKTATV